MFNPNLLTSFIQSLRKEQGDLDLTYNMVVVVSGGIRPPTTML